jgi:hypothetical protein
MAGALAIVALLALRAAYLLQRELSRTLRLYFDYAQPVVPMPLNPGDLAVGTFFWLHGIEITNQSVRRVNLTPFLLLELKDGRSLRVRQMKFPVVPPDFTAAENLLWGTIRIGPEDTAEGDLGFPLIGWDQPWDGGYRGNAKTTEDGLPIIKLVLVDRTSGAEQVFDVTQPKMLPKPPTSEPDETT